MQLVSSLQASLAAGLELWDAEQSENESESEVTQSHPTLSDPMDCGLPGSSTHGISQARVLEWGAITTSAA